MHRTIFVVLVVVLVGTAWIGCSPTYSPPLRTTHVGAPRALAKAQAELGVGASVHHKWSRGAALGVGVTESVRVEVASDIGHAWQLGMVGLRAATGDAAAGGWVSDVEGGVGAGYGGQTCSFSDPPEDEDADGGSCQSDGQHWEDRPAYGTYIGAGIAHHWEQIALYARTRGQLTRAENVPTTKWGSAVLGGQLHAGTHMRLYAAGGMAGYHNEDDSESGLILDAGLAVSTP